MHFRASENFTCWWSYWSSWVLQGHIFSLLPSEVYSSVTLAEGFHNSLLWCKLLDEIRRWWDGSTSRLMVSRPNVRSFQKTLLVSLLALQVPFSSMDPNSKLGAKSLKPCCALTIRKLHRSVTCGANWKHFASSESEYLSFCYFKRVAAHTCKKKKHTRTQRAHRYNKQNFPPLSLSLSFFWKLSQKAKALPSPASSLCFCALRPRKSMAATPLLKPPVDLQYSLSLYVGDLDPEVTEMDLRTAFCSVCPIYTLRLCRCAYTGKSLCYGYVNFYSHNQGIILYQLIHPLFLGRLIDSLFLYLQTFKLSLYIYIHTHLCGWKSVILWDWGLVLY